MHISEGAVWKKGSRSNGSGGNNCVEVAMLDNGVAVRDSKENGAPAQMILMFSKAEWAAFVDSAKDGEFDS
jgi:hypothetical protein